MPPSALLLLAAASLFCLPHLHAATRPLYGGTLRMALRSAPQELDPDQPGDAWRLASLVFERLVRLDESGHPEPALASSWEHDAAFRRWQFRIRPGVRFHDGFALVPAAVAAVLRPALRKASLSVAADTVVIQFDRPVPDALALLARGPFVFARNAEGGFTGTGPFRITRWESGRAATLSAFQDYWEGRPFLDAVEVTFGRGPREQLIDLELNKTDLVELSPADVRRVADQGRSIWSTQPVRLLALRFTDPHAHDARLRRALSLCIDRSAIHSVLLQRQGEPSGAILPQWLSGYAFLFSQTPDLPEARKLSAQTASRSRSLALGYDPADPVFRSIAERIAVNARDAGISIVAVPGSARPDVRLVDLTIDSPSPALALEKIAAALGLEEPVPPDASPEALYRAERRLVESALLVPLVHLPEAWAVGSRVAGRFAPGVGRLGDWFFADVWLRKNQ